MDNFDYDLPASRIAQSPLAERAQSRLLVAPQGGLNTGSGADPVDGVFCELSKWLAYFLERQCGAAFQNPSSGARRPPLVILNESKVYPARIPIVRHRVLESGVVAIAAGEVFLLGLDEHGLRETGKEFEALLRPQKKLRPGDTLCAPTRGSESGPPLFKVVSWGEETCRVRALLEPGTIVDTYGAVPLPPYIRRAAPGDSGMVPELDDSGADHERYQTVFARHLGSAAAPTAGLHLTTELIRELEASKAACFASVTLHVGLGTFRPVQVDDPALHRMHSERYSIPQETLSKIANALLHQDPIVFVGTTTFRAVESFLLQGLELENSCSGQESVAGPGLGQVVLSERLFSGYQSLAERWLETDLFVRPTSDPHSADPSGGNRGLFRCYAPMIGNGMITNFHQPKSTLLMLVAALCGVDFIKSVYRHALGSGYRFLSYGDASLIGFGASPRLVVPGDQALGVQFPGAEVT